MNVVEYHRHSVAWRFSQADIPRNDAVKDLRTEEASQVGSNLLRECRAVVVHREQDAFDRERGVDCTAKACQGVEQFRNPLEGQELALNWNQNGVAGGQRIHGENIE